LEGEVAQSSILLGSNFAGGTRRAYRARTSTFDGAETTSEYEAVRTGESLTTPLHLNVGVELSPTSSMMFWVSGVRPGN